jgi:hypothetical protein
MQVRSTAAAQRLSVVVVERVYNVLYLLIAVYALTYTY